MIGVVRSFSEDAESCRRGELVEAVSDILGGGGMRMALGRLGGDVVCAALLTERLRY
jgi:hypothetical protein